MSNQNLDAVPHEIDLENVRSGYQAAVDLWVYEGTTIWAKFTAMVYANTILLATLGLVITSSRAADFGVLRVALAILGLSLCAAWAVLTKRSFEYYRYWILSARELEGHLPPVRMIARGGAFADGAHITIDITPPTKLKMRGVAKWRIEWVSYFLIAVFAVVYLLTLLQR